MIKRMKTGSKFAPGYCQVKAIVKSDCQSQGYSYTNSPM